MLIQLTKRTDGGGVIRCIRSDGSVTWHTHRGPQAAFFPQHDLTHYAVESVLGIDRAFYGLLAAGWDFEDTGGKGARGPLPAEAVMVEHIVGLFDVERAGGGLLRDEDMRAALAGYVAQHGWPAGTARLLDDDTIARIRARRSQLFGRFRELAAGAALELDFPFSQAAA